MVILILYIFVIVNYSYLRWNVNEKPAPVGCCRCSLWHTDWQTKWLIYWLIDWLQESDERSQSQGHIIFKTFPKTVSVINQSLLSTLYYTALYHFEAPEVIHWNSSYLIRFFLYLCTLKIEIYFMFVIVIFFDRFRIFLDFLTLKIARHCITLRHLNLVDVQIFVNFPKKNWPLTFWDD